ncbi:SRPBCC family protein [Novosphingobium pentaromativorans]|uniref:Polyketide cyclase/dehydrase n=1 Tax=Novosphingobium pentaromativorans US6-1 TaxID=1088721 RepID=G6E9B2_9SPHN|nr:SRPBCC family protein [Novosphingobium pentaromativorans]AIT81078.1 polyketide cyclase [Novosphingobium pentaromativorans US6-1]EHJ62336.1 hypothetical protein NSU_0933 [Novosphingobium pentaromativorans US6-1]
MKSAAFALALALFGSAVPAWAKVAEVSERGFVVRHLVEVSAGPAKTWDMILDPAKWWESSHTWSGDAANLSIEAKAGGCFCEVLRNPKSPNAAPRGSVEHMRVVYIENGRALRMVGALGPLQADAANGTLTIEIKPGKEGTQVLLEYVVGGFLRKPMDKLAPAVDGMLGAQLASLADKLGSPFSAAFPLPDDAPEGAPTAEKAGPPTPPASTGDEIIGR